MIITALEPQKRRRRVNVYGEDGAFLLALEAALLQESGLHVGADVPQSRLDSLRREDGRRQAYDAAIRLLSYRPRSEREVRQRLARRGWNRDVIERALARLRRNGYLNDVEFARFWTETRQATSPRSGRLIRNELRAKGVRQETAKEAVAAVDDEQAAYGAASRRLRAFPLDDFEAFHSRLGAFLLRRGFSYEVAHRRVERCWREAREGAETPVS